jgi:hypothetical protein
MLVVEKVKEFRAAWRLSEESRHLKYSRLFCGALPSRRYARLNLNVILLP